MLHVRETHAPSTSLRLPRTESSGWQLTTSTYGSFRKFLLLKDVWNLQLWLTKWNKQKIIQQHWNCLLQRPDQPREPPHICKSLILSWNCWRFLNKKCWPTHGLAQLGILCNYNRLIWNNQGSVNLAYSPGESTSSCTITNETQMLLFYSLKQEDRAHAWDFSHWEPICAYFRSAFDKTTSMFDKT